MQLLQPQHDLGEHLPGRFRGQPIPVQLRECNGQNAVARDGSDKVQMRAGLEGVDERGEEDGAGACEACQLAALLEQVGDAAGRREEVGLGKSLSWKRQASERRRTRRTIDMAPCARGRSRT